MLVTPKNIKEFRKSLKERRNQLEATVGELLSLFVGEVQEFGLELYCQHAIEVEGRKSVFDYALRIRHRDAEDWVLLELKQYEDPGLLVPYLAKFGEDCNVFALKYPECGVHRMFIVDTAQDSLPANLSHEATKQRVSVVHSTILILLRDQIEAVGPAYAMLEFLKNAFNLSVKYPDRESVEVMAVRHTHADVTNYTFSIPGRTLLRLAYVFRASATSDPNLEEAYQRSVDARRLPKIKKFIQSDHVGRMFPNNIIANIPLGSSAVVTDSSDVLTNLVLPNEYGALWLIDGQHRVLSLARCDEEEWKALADYPFLVTTYKGLRTREQAKLFFSINDEQTGINPNLICYILSRLLDDKEGASAYVALRMENMNIFSKGIYAGVGRRAGRWLNLKTFVDGLCPSQGQRENLIDYSADETRRGWLQKTSQDLDTPVEILHQYFSVISENFKTDWANGKAGFCQSNPGMAVWLRILMRIAQRESNWKAFAENWSRKQFTRYIGRCDYKTLRKRIPNLDVEEWRGVRDEPGYNAVAEFLWSEMT
jgi:DGQHR domain-containing protein